MVGTLSKEGGLYEVTNLTRGNYFHSSMSPTCFPLPGNPVLINQPTNYSIKLPIPNKNKIYAKKDLYCNNINSSQRYQDSDSAYILCHPVLMYLPVEMCVWKIISNQVPTDSTCQDQHSSSSSSITADSPDFHRQSYQTYCCRMPPSSLSYFVALE